MLRFPISNKYRPSNGQTPQFNYVPNMRALGPAFSVFFLVAVLNQSSHDPIKRLEKYIDLPAYAGKSVRTTDEQRTYISYIHNN